MRVVHLIPYDGIGGVERAARSMGSMAWKSVTLTVETIFPRPAAAKRFVLGNPLFFGRSIFRILRNPPNILIVSLWRAYLVGILVKLFRPSVRLIVFLHFPNDVHFVDRHLTRLAARLAEQVWSDSHETLSRRIPSRSSDKKRIISFVTERISPLHSQSAKPSFVFWGRIHSQKGIDRALRIFYEIGKRCTGARFWIIGPDGGDLSRLRELSKDLEIDHSVQFLGPMNINGIKQVAGKASFYLQTSTLEGMAMSVVEGMQFGLVPIVTPVGEIGNYCKHLRNAVVIDKDEDAVNDVMALLNNNQQFQTLRKNAIETWLDRPLYRDDIANACMELLKDRLQ